MPHASARCNTRPEREGIRMGSDSRGGAEARRKRVKKRAGIAGTVSQLDTPCPVSSSSFLSFHFCASAPLREILPRLPPAQRERPRPRGCASAVRWPPPWERQAPAWHGTLCRIGYLCPARWLGQPGCHAWRPAKGGGVRRGPAHLPRDQKENARAMAGGRKSGGERVFHSSTK